MQARAFGGHLLAVKDGAGELLAEHLELSGELKHSASWGLSGLRLITFLRHADNDLFVLALRMKAAVAEEVSRPA